ncbi:hypothetical protein ABQF33_11675 [Mycolicibacterium sp. XJ2]
MRMAVDLGKQSIQENPSINPYVGAVIVRNGDIIGSGFRGMAGRGAHAEFGALQTIDPDLLRGATVFSTLEPCSQRGPTKIPCANRLAQAGIAVAYIGVYDPNPVIYRQGWRILTEAGVRVRDFPADLRDEIAIDNALFLTRFKRLGGDRGEIAFDYRLRGGKYRVVTTIGGFTIDVGERDSDSVYLYDETNNVGDPRFARDFEEIDDPGALEFNAPYVVLEVGEIACLRSVHGYLLVQLTGVDRSQGRHGVAFRWEVRGVAEPPDPDADA